MSGAKTGEKASLIVAGADLDRLMAIMQPAQNAFKVTIFHAAHAVSSLPASQDQGAAAAVIEIDPTASALDVRALLDRSPNVRFVFVARELPLRHAIARVIRENGHVVVAPDESPLVIAATVAALLAERETAQ
jgi:hypothetical protein